MAEQSDHKGQQHRRLRTNRSSFSGPVAHVAQLRQSQDTLSFAVSSLEACESART